MLSSPNETAERFRAWAFQPLADAVDAHLGVNCFDAAAHLLVLNALGDVAYQAHLATTGDPNAHGPLVLALHVGLWVCDVRMARKLREFSRAAERSLGVRFNHGHRRGTWLGLDLLLVLGAQCVTDMVRTGVHPSGWTAFDHVACLSFPVALFLAACEWRRRPPTRARRPSPCAGAA